MAKENEALTEKDIKSMHEGLGELRRLVEGKDAGTAEVKEKVEKIEKQLDEIEEKNQKFVAEKAVEAKKFDDLQKQYDELEAKMSRMPGGSKQEAEAKAELKAFEVLVQKGASGVAEQERKYLRTDSDTEGGYLAPAEYVSEIIKQITEFSPIRQLARSRRTSRGEIEIPKRTGKPTAAFRGEGIDITASQSSYGMVKVPVGNLDALVIATTNMLTDAAFNMETEINGDVVESFTEVEGDRFLNGDGVNAPEGLLTNADVGIVNSGIANDITADNFFDVQGELKQGYNATWLLNRRTLAKVRKMKGADGHYLFTPATQGAPNSIAGDPYMLAIHMPDVGAGNTPVLYGDFLKGYTVVDGVQMTVLRDPYVLGASGKVRFIFSKRTGGKVTLAEALKKLKCST